MTGVKIPMSKPSLLSGSERQMHQPVAHGPVKNAFRFQFFTLHVSRRRRHLANRVVAQDALHFLAALFPLPAIGDLAAVVHHQHVRQVFADRQFGDSGQSSQGRPDSRDRNLARVGAIHLGGRGQKRNQQVRSIVILILD